jgi:hypothetical protein
MNRADKSINALLILLLGFFSLVFLYHAGRLVLYPYTVDYGEGFILDDAIHFAHLENPYTSLDSPPWVVRNYPPVYPGLVSIGVALFGVQFTVGRILSTLGILITGYALGRMVQHQTGDRLAAWVSALLWVASYPVYNRGALLRVDSVGLAFQAIGLLLVLKKNHLNWAIVFFLLGLYTRQTYWMGPIAAYFYLRRLDGARFAARWLLSLLVSGGVIFGLLVLLTRGEFYNHIVAYNANAFYWKDVWRYLHNAMMKYSVVPMAFMFYLIIRAALSGRWDLASCCMPLAIGTFLLSGKVGSATNYLFELTFAGAWATGLGLAELRTLLPLETPFRMIPGLLLCLTTCFPMHLPHLYGEWEIWDWGGTPIASSGAPVGELIERLKTLPEPVLSQDAGVALQSGHELLWHPFVMNQLEQEGRWNPSQLHQMIREEKFSAIVLPVDLHADRENWKAEGYWQQFNARLAYLINDHYQLVPYGPPEIWQVNPRLKGYFSPFGTNYLYLPRGVKR